MTLSCDTDLSTCWWSLSDATEGGGECPPRGVVGLALTTDRSLVTFTTDGEPVVDGLPVDRIVRADGVAYMARHHLGLNVRFHHLLTDDPQLDLHDHPWDFTSLLLTGGYREWTPDGSVDYWAPTVLCRSAEALHRLELLDGPMWTLISCGPARRRWGFRTGRGWVYWREYPGAGTYEGGEARPQGLRRPVRRVRSSRDW